MRSEKMLAARSQRLEGTNPRAVGRAKARQALEWVYRWGWASHKTIDGLAGVKRRGLAAKLARQGLLQATRTESGGAVDDVPGHILTLTKLGQAEVEKWREELLQYDVDPYRVRQDLLRHNELAQRATASALANGKIVGYETEKEMCAKSEKGVKQPDAAWQLQDGKRVAVEIELSGKWARDLDQFILACVSALSSSENEQARFNLLALVTDSPAIQKRYKSAFTAGTKYGHWQKDSRGRWTRMGTNEVPAWMKGKVLWRLIES